MTNQEILENNKLIAKFMGWNEHPKYNTYVINLDPKRKTPYWSNINYEGSLDDFNYHSSWDWLMQVIEKIEEMVDKNDTHYNVLSSRTSLLISTHSNPEYIVNYNENKLKAHWLTIVEFIKWYNQNK